jgi:hypothetical protein
MTNLYHLSTKNFSAHCFAHTPEEALEHIKENCNFRPCYSYVIKLVEDDTLNEDGVSFLREKNFIGIPKVKFFLLNGSEAHWHDHFYNQKKTHSLWWSEKVPGSENLWKKETV